MDKDQIKKEKIKTTSSVSISNALGTKVDVDKALKDVDKLNSEFLNIEDYINKTKGDIDLKDYVLKILEKDKEYNSKAIAVFNKHPSVLASENVHSLTQRLLLTSFLTSLIIIAKGIIIDLEDPGTVMNMIPTKGTHKEWLQVIEGIVIPYMLENKIFDLFIVEEQDK